MSAKDRIPPPSDPNNKPQRPRGCDWEDALLAAMKDPKQIFEEDEQTFTLYDGYPKSKYHYLVVPKEDIYSVKELTRKNLDLLRHMHGVAEGLVSRIKSREPSLEFKFGYHAVPSLRRLHMHVVSCDFSSWRMRRKHHWNTFNTKYFMPSSLVIETLENCGAIDVDEKMYVDLLALPMKCLHCSQHFEDMKLLKKHLSSNKHV